MSSLIYIHLNSHFLIALDKLVFSLLKSIKSIDIFFFISFLHKNICCGYSLKCFAEALLMNTHNICFCGEIKKTV